MVVENHAGAGGRIGAKVVAGAAPDGYTLLLGGTNVNAIAGAIYRDLGFDPINSFVPIASICTDSMGLAVSPNVPVNSFQELVAYAKANPGKLKYGAPPGTTPNLPPNISRPRPAPISCSCPTRVARPRSPTRSAAIST